MTPDEIQKWLLECENPETEQRIQVLKMNPTFLQDATSLRARWTNFIKQHKILIERILKLVFKIQNKLYLDSTKHYKPSKKDINKLSLLGKQHQELFRNTEFNKDIFTLSKKYKLYPIKSWQYPLIFFIITNDFYPPNYWPGLGLLDYSSSQEMIQLPRDMNFDLRIENDNRTKEPELLIHVYENTSLQDLKKHWKIINIYKNKLKQLKKTGKRYYPRKNLATEKQLAELDKTNLSDWEKQEKIYGEIPSADFGKEERKRRARIETIRHRSKKRLT